MQAPNLLTADPRAVAAWRDALLAVVDCVERALPSAPVSGANPTVLRALFAGDPFPERGCELTEALRHVDAVVRHSVVVGHPRTTAHLQCPPCVPALAVDAMIAALNQSMDSFDQAPAATIIEQQLIDWLAREAGLPAGAAGSFTSGATQSNLMGLWMARDAAFDRPEALTRNDGLPVEARRCVILTSAAAHFTVEKSAMALGLGAQAVIRIPTDARFRMDGNALREAIAKFRSEGRRIVAIVATAGTTDHGSIDPLAEIATIARHAGVWLHIDAAYGGALLWSPTRRAALYGLEHADSIALDFHKLLWQPIGCGAFLVRHSRHFAAISTRADYLNPEDHDICGVPDLVNRSIATTRRFDALKLAVTLRVYGRLRLGAMIDRVCRMSRAVAAAVRRRPQLELVHASEYLSTVLFRYRAHRNDGVLEETLNAEIPRHLYGRGIAVIGATRVFGRRVLKLTLLNPEATLADYERILDAVVARGAARDSATRVGSHFVAANAT